MSTTSRRCSGGSARPSYTLLLKRCRELEEARVFNNWLGERRRRLDDMSAPTGGRSCRAVIGKALRSQRLDQLHPFQLYVVEM